MVKLSQSSLAYFVSCTTVFLRQSSLPKLAAMVAYAASFEVEFSLHLRERISHDL